MTEIQIQVMEEANEVQIEVIKEIAERHEIYAKYKGNGFFKFTAEDPENLFWFGCNFPKFTNP